MNVYLEILEHKGEKYLRLNYESRYAAGSCPINTPEDLVREIENICGKGSYCFYYKPKDFETNPASYSDKVINHFDYEKYPNLPRLTYWQQGVKTQVIEQCREVAEEVWGDIPEMEIGWLENACRTYVD